MLVKEFLDTLAVHPNAALLFEYDDGRFVAPGFHVTEIKNTTYETIDCGNSLHTWNEIIAQLWVPDDVEPGSTHMTAALFSKIWSVVADRIQLDPDAEIRIEYGDEESRTALYHVDSISEGASSLTISLVPQRTLCKPRAILVDLNPGAEELQDACCGPANETVLPLPSVRPKAAEPSGCC
ncbi:MAG: hypothetical protein KJN81_04450 [Acidimicrobiia bacterium]|nr:hypothetical protein [Acidimicrobiia bacterium]NNL27659.1 hypothetical protein [Acidimicrobiia bacterium]